MLRHLDLYRLADDPRELEVLGLPDALRGAPVCVEWPGRAIRAALPPTVEVAIEAQTDESRGPDPEAVGSEAGADGVNAFVLPPASWFQKARMNPPFAPPLVSQLLCLQT